MTWSRRDFFRRSAIAGAVPFATRHPAGAIGAVAVAGLTGAASPATTEWFGVPTPPQATDVTASVSWDNPIEPAPFPFAEQDRTGPGRELLDGDRARQDVEQIVAFSRESRQAGDLLWGRMSGMPALNRTVEWCVEQFRNAGIEDARVETFDSPPLWLPASFELRLVGDDAYGAGTQDVVLQSAFPQDGGAPIPGGALTAPLVYVGHGTPADLTGRDVVGRIAVLGVDNVASVSHTPQRGVPAALVEAGAVGVVSIIDGPGNMQYFDSRLAAGTTPCFTVGGRDGAFLEGVLAAAGPGGAPNLTMSLDSELRDALRSSNGVAVIPGTSGRNVIINAHADGFFDAAGDNADGLATLIAQARYFAQREQPLHSIIFVASAGHHSPGNGPAAFVAAHPDLMRDNLLVLNIEHVAQLDLERGVSAATDGNLGNTWVPVAAEQPKHAGVSSLAPYLVDLWREGVSRFGILLDQDLDERVPGDLGGFAPTGTPLTQMIAANALYHSSGDVAESISTPAMEKATRFHAYFIEQIAQAPEEALTP